MCTLWKMTCYFGKIPSSVSGQCLKTLVRTKRKSSNAEQGFCQLCRQTHVGESGKSAQITDTHQAEHKPFSSFGQQVGELVQHGCNYTFQTCKLQCVTHTREAWDNRKVGQGPIEPVPALIQITVLTVNVALTQWFLTGTNIIMKENQTKYGVMSLADCNKPCLT